jgi:hypothetical protein
MPRLGTGPARGHLHRRPQITIRATRLSVVKRRRADTFVFRWNGAQIGQRRRRLAHRTHFYSDGGILSSLEVESDFRMSRNMRMRKYPKGLRVHLLVNVSVFVLLICFTARAIKDTPNFQSHYSNRRAQSHSRFTEGSDSRSDIRIEPLSIPQLFNSLGPSRRNSRVSNPSQYQQLLIDDLAAVGKPSMAAVPSFRAPPFVSELTYK